MPHVALIALQLIAGLLLLAVGYLTDSIPLACTAGFVVSAIAVSITSLLYEDGVILTQHETLRDMRNHDRIIRARTVLEESCLPDCPECGNQSRHAARCGLGRTIDLLK